MECKFNPSGVKVFADKFLKIFSDLIKICFYDSIINFIILLFHYYLMVNFTISVSGDGKDFIEKMRKKIPGKKIPTQKETIDLIIKYVSNNETEFLIWTESSRIGEK